MDKTRPSSDACANFAANDDTAATSIAPSRAFINPKQLQRGNGSGSWYRYYAGYSPNFVAGAIQRIGLQQGQSVLDPWNGSGTTTSVASDAGMRSFGFDLNPVAVIVARSRTASASDATRALEVLRSVDPEHLKAQGNPNDPLNHWFSGASATAVRRLQAWLRDQFEASHAFSAVTCPILAVVYTALFRSLRSAAIPARSKNPTWVRLELSPADRIRLTPRRLLADVTMQLEGMIAELQLERPSRPRFAPLFEVSPAHRLPLPDESIDAVIASPPYCTRIDYAVSTAVELAMLGYRMDSGIAALRNKMTGTSTIRDRVADLSLNPQWGRACCSLMRSIAVHPSKASSTYYLKTHHQYFADVHAAVVELSRCVKPSGHCVLVVQDSFYKDIHNPLPVILQEMFLEQGWRLRDQQSFAVKHDIGRTNRKSLLYKRDRTATESVLWFGRG